jgi:hypothetical protein
VFTKNLRQPKRPPSLPRKNLSTNLKQPKHCPSLASLFHFTIRRHPTKREQNQVADVNKMKEQVKDYLKRGFPAKTGLVECGVNVRRHTPQLERFNEIWWSEICRGSYQDQLSVMVAARKAGVEINRIPGSIQNLLHLSLRRRGNQLTHCPDHLNDIRHPGRHSSVLNCCVVQHRRNRCLEE